MLRKIKKILTATPVHINNKPLALWKLFLPLFFFVLLIGGFFLFKYTTKPPTQEEVAFKKYQEAKKQAEILGSKVAKQADVPTDETPNVATVTDVSKLQGQEFFKQAKNGDKLLIYEKKKIIALYRPSEDRVIATAPVLYNQPTPAVAATSSASSTASGSLQPQRNK
jgi:hypothetical protein